MFQLRHSIDLLLNIHRLDIRMVYLDGYLGTLGVSLVPQDPLPDVGEVPLTDDGVCKSDV